MGFRGPRPTLRPHSCPGSWALASMEATLKECGGKGTPRDSWGGLEKGLTDKQPGWSWTAGPPPPTQPSRPSPAPTPTPYAPPLLGQPGSTSHTQAAHWLPEGVYPECEPMVSCLAQPLGGGKAPTPVGGGLPKWMLGPEVGLSPSVYPPRLIQDPRGGDL